MQPSEIEIYNRHIESKTSTNGCDRSSPVYDGASTENVDKTPQQTVKHISEIGRNIILRVLKNEKMLLAIAKYNTLGGKCKIPYTLAKRVDFNKNPRDSVDSIHDFISRCCCASCLEYMHNVVCLERIGMVWYRMVYSTMMCKCEACSIFYLYSGLNDFEYIFNKL